MKPRFKYYSWVTRLAEMLTDDKQCHYAQALMTQYQVEKKPSNYDSSEHDEMVVERARQLQAEGYKVYVEEENSFKYHGKYFPICVGGRPDLRPMKGNQLIVEDCKSGRRKHSHKMQVLLYMFLLPFAPETKALYQGKIPHGRIIYQDGIVDIYPEEVNAEFQQKLRNVIATLCNSTLPQATPNKWECRYCPIPHSHCPAYYSSEIA
jgi:hypothetical protein